MKSAGHIPLSRERIIAAALHLGSEQGLNGLSMRRVAGELGVEAMSLYNHVPNKAAIIHGMVDQVMAQIPVPDSTLPWPERLRVLGTGMYGRFSRHPIVVTIIATGMASPRTVAGLRPIEEMLAALHAAGFDPLSARRAANALTALVFGAINLRPARSPATSPGPQEDERQWFMQNVDADTLPHLFRTLRADSSPDESEDFAEQLDLLITGLETEARRSSPD